MLMPVQVGQYYPELSDPDMESALALVHSRFSTNTFPSWDRSHPYRYLAHNGEINTLRGNINWMYARQSLFDSDLFGDDLKKILPVIDLEGVIRQFSIMPWNCWCFPVAHCLMR
jgi:glutamate synthase (ferredoxin)